MVRARSTGSAVFAAAASLLVAACGDDDVAPLVDSGPVDAAMDSGALDADMPSAVAPPRPPVFTPCPAGWREVADGGSGFAVCEPYPSSSPEACEPADAHFPGQPACEQISTDCAADGWPTDLPPDPNVVFVRAEAASGDGSRAAPYGTIGEAIRAAPDGAVVAVAVGLYEESVLIDRPLTMRGACAETIITANFAVRVVALGVRIENLKVAGGLIGVRVGNAGSVTLRDLVLEDNSVTALNVDDGSVDAERVSVRRAGDTGITCARGTATVRRASLVEVGGIAIDVRECDFRLADATITGTGGGVLPQLVNAGRASTTLLERVAFVDNIATEVAVFEESSLAAHDVVFRQAPEGATTQELSVIAFGGGQIELQRSRIERGRTVALGATLAGSALSVRDVWIRDTLVGPESTFAYGVEISEGATADIARLRVDSTRSLGVLVSGVDSAVTAEDLAIEGTDTNAAGAFGRALQVQLGAALNARRLSALRGHEAGIVATSARIDAVDVRVDDVVGGGLAEDGPGIGVGAYQSADVDLERFAIRSAALAGAQVASESELDLFDGEIRENPIGVNVQVDDYELGRVMNRVFYRDNGVNLDAESLPVPDPTVGTSG